MTYQRNTLLTIFENWNEVAEATQVAADAAGTAESKYNDYMDSMQAHLNTLSTTWSEFLMNMSQSGAFTGFIDGITSVISALDWLITKTPAATIAVTALALAFARFTIAKAATAIGSFIKMASNLTALEGLKTALTAFKAKDIATGMATLGTTFKGMLSTMLGLKTAGAAAAEAAGVAGAAAGAAGAEATVGAVGFGAFGSALAAIAPYVAIVAAVGVAIWGVGKALDAAIVTVDELEDSIKDHEEALQNIQSEVDGYNSKLEENKARLEEIQKLQKLGKATTADNAEADAIERQNASLERQIALKERMAEVERANMAIEQNKLFRAKYLDSDNSQRRKSGNMDYGANIQGLKDQIRDYETSIQDYNKAVEAWDKADMQGKDKAADKMTKAQQKMTEREQDLLKLRSEIEGMMDSLSDTNRAEAQNMLNILDTMSMSSGEFATYGEYFENAAAQADEAGHAVLTLADNLTTLAGTEFMPKDADSMEEWLGKLEETDLDHLQWLFENVGASAGDLANILSNMPGADAIDLVNNTYERYHGTIQECTDGLSEFKAALEMDFDEQARGVVEMSQYLQKSLDAGGSDNIKAYNAALKGMGLNTNATAEEIKNAIAGINKYYDASSGELKLDKFESAVIDALKANGELGSVMEENGEIISLNISDYAGLANQLGLTDPVMMAFVHSCERWWEVSDQRTSTALETSLKNVAKNAKEASSSTDTALTSMEKTYKGVFSKIKTVTEDGTVSYKFNINPEATDAAKANLITQLNRIYDDLVSKAQEIEKSTGIKINVPIEWDENASDEENLAKWISSYQTQLNKVQQVINTEGKIDISAFENSIKKLGDIAGDIEIDGNKITFKTEEAAQKFTQQLQKDFAGIDMNQIIATALSQGIEFEQVLPSNSVKVGAEAFEVSDHVADSIGNTVSEGIQNALDSKEVVVQNIVSEELANLQGQIESVGGQADTLTKQAGDAAQAVNDIGKTNVNGTIVSMSTLAGMAGSAAGQLRNVSNYLSDIAKNKNQTIIITYTSVGTPPKATAANGLQAYANGGEVLKGVPLRQQQNSNALVGEEGRELVIDKYGKKRVVGANGAEMVRLKKGDTVVPNNVTEMIAKNRIGTFPTGFTSETRGTTSGSIQTTGRAKPVKIQEDPNDKSSKKSSKSAKSSASGATKSAKKAKKAADSAEKSAKKADDAYKKSVEKMLKELEHQYNMEYLTEANYYRYSSEIWEKYYKGRATYQDEDWELQEKLHEQKKKLWEEENSQIEFQISLLEKRSGTEQQRLDLYTQEQGRVHERAQALRDIGYTDDTEQIRDLQQQWQEIEDSKRSIESDIYEKNIESFNREITLLQKRSGTEQQQIALYQKIQQATMERVAALKAQDLDETSDDIRSVTDEYYDAMDKISEAMSAMYDNMISDTDHTLTLLEEKLNRLPPFVDDFTDSMAGMEVKLNKYVSDYLDIKTQQIIRYKSQISETQTELNRLYKEGYEINKERIQELEEHVESLKSTIHEIAEDIRSLKLDAVEKQITHEDRVRQGIVDYANKQKDIIAERVKLLQKENDELDRQDQLEQLQDAIKDAEDGIDDAIKDRKDAEEDLEKAKKDLEEAKKDRDEKKDIYEHNKGQRNLRVYHEGQGWVWEKDVKKIEEEKKEWEDAEEKVKDAEKAVEDAEDKLKDATKAIEDANKALEDAKKALDKFDRENVIRALQEEMDKWDDYIAKVEATSEQFEKQLNAQAVELELGKNWQMQIFQDMMDNLGLTVDNSVGLIQQLINKYNELYDTQKKLTEAPTESFLEGLDTSLDNIQDITMDDGTVYKGVSYDKNHDYAADINALQAMIDQQEKESGTHDTWFDEVIKMRQLQRRAKIEGENLNEDGTPKTGNINIPNTQKEQAPLNREQTEYNSNVGVSLTELENQMAMAHKKADELRAAGYAESSAEIKVQQDIYNKAKAQLDSIGRQMEQGQNKVNTSVNSGTTQLTNTINSGVSSTNNQLTNTNTQLTNVNTNVTSGTTQVTTGLTNVDNSVKALGGTIQNVGNSITEMSTTMQAKFDASDQLYQSALEAARRENASNRNIPANGTVGYDENGKFTYQDGARIPEGYTEQVDKNGKVAWVSPSGQVKIVTASQATKNLYTSWAQKESSGSSSSSSRRPSSSSTLSSTVSGAISGAASGGASGGLIGGVIGAIVGAVSSASKKSSSSSSSSKKSSSSSSSKSASSSVPKGYGSGKAGSRVSYASGGINDYTGLAMLHGEHQKSEVVFNAEDAKKLWQYIHNMKPQRPTSTGELSLLAQSLNKAVDSSKGDIHIGTINLPQVKNANDFVTQLRRISMNR